MPGLLLLLGRIIFLSWVIISAESKGTTVLISSLQRSTTTISTIRNKVRMVRNRTSSNETITTTGSTSPTNDTAVSRTGNDTNYYVAQKERPVRSQTLSPSISPLEQHQQQQQGQSIMNVSDQVSNNSNQPTTDGLLVVNASQSDTYYPCLYTNENVSTLTVVFDNEGTMTNISTSRPPINNYNSNNSDIHGWGELFLFLCWSVTILFCCVLPTFILFARKARQDQQQPSVRGMLLRTTTNSNNNNHTSSTSNRLTLRQHLFVNSPGWKRYVKAVLFDAWKDTKVVVCKEHFCETTTNHKTSPTRRKSETASSSSSPLKSVLCAAAKITSAAQPLPHDSKKKPYKKIKEVEDEECGCSIASNDTFQTAVTNTYINDNDDDVSVISKSGLFLNIPIPKSRRAKQGRKIPNSCAICLDSYEIGDTMVWSTSSDSSSSSSNSGSSDNNKCLHAFHEHCISAWCLRKIEENFSSSNSRSNISVPCPCCRQSFVTFHLDLDHAAANHRSRDDGDSQTEATIIFRQRESFEI